MRRCFPAQRNVLVVALPVPVPGRYRGPMSEIQAVYPPGRAAAVLRGLVRACGEQGEEAPDISIGDDGMEQAVLVPAVRYRRIVREVDKAVLALQAAQRLGDAPGPGKGLSDDDLTAWVADHGATGSA